VKCRGEMSVKSNYGGVYRVKLLIKAVHTALCSSHFLITMRSSSWRSAS
jgi:hypothetical protein